MCFPLSDKHSKLVRSFTWNIFWDVMIFWSWSGDWQLRTLKVGLNCSLSYSGRGVGSSELWIAVCLTVGEGLAVQNSELQSCLTVGEGLAVENSELQSCLTVGEGLAVQNSELQSVLQWERGWQLRTLNCSLSYSGRGVGSWELLNCSVLQWERGWQFRTLNCSLSYCGRGVGNSELWIAVCLTVGEGLVIQNSELQSVLQWERGWQLRTLNCSVLQWERGWQLRTLNCSLSYCGRGVGNSELWIAVCLTVGEGLAAQNFLEVGEVE